MVIHNWKNGKKYNFENNKMNDLCQMYTHIHIYSQGERYSSFARLSRTRYSSSGRKFQGKITRNFEITILLIYNIYNVKSFKRVRIRQEHN